ncbi:hypothetical protein RGQ15_11485 [Paracoccus sp. MBLB3053]|uniref:Uncharacterized protein n=1 Tax=Paracoccus aurantius TaxID=3073814 RepID=A0ABU2HT29_9RHOB|nr:hypothetical protein [Paracoccus sp. MBLB3053]MDS9468188.1 hypothetical protein [Paracoccus sp. MBLB3053]
MNASTRIITVQISPYVSWQGEAHLAPRRHQDGIAIQIKRLRRHAHGHPLSIEDEAHNAALDEVLATLSQADAIEPATTPTATVPVVEARRFIDRHLSGREEAV